MNVEQEEDLHSCEFGDLLTSYLEALGVAYVFGVPGGAIEPLVNALVRSERRGGPRHVVCRHETGAAFMAAGYQAVSGRLGVCYATTGPGATNLVTGVASADASNIPLLVITAQTALNTFGRSALQESSCTGTDTLAIFAGITRYNSLVSHPAQFEHKLAAALLAAHRSPSGPVHLSVPIDVMKAMAGEPRFPQLPALIKSGVGFDSAAIDTFVAWLAEGRRAVFVLGNAASGAVADITELANLLDIALVTTPQGKGLVDPGNPFYRGVAGFAGHATALNSLRDPAVELVVVIGSSLGEWASNGWDQQAILNGRLVHVSSQENHFYGSPMARLHLRGDIAQTFREVRQRLAVAERARRPPALQREALQQEVLQREVLPREVLQREVLQQKVTPRPGGYPFNLDDPAAITDDRQPLLPQRLMAELPRLFPAATHYFADSGNSLAWAVHYLHPPGPGAGGEQEVGRFHGSFDFASMGWAIACSVGAALALGGDTPVVCITGDGSYLMSSQEITVAIQQRLPVIYLILNDACYGMVKHGQRLNGAEPTGFELPVIDYAAMARAMGVEGYTITSVDDLRALDIAHICRRRGPTLLDVHIDPEATPPIGLRTHILKGG